ncbi:response regulator [candidate division KSB1 bacterium]|nr:response regulator [candidate division KSB1 bacterium]
MSRILVIDDIDEARNTVCKILTRNGFDVVEAYNGKEAIKLVKNNMPDLVITDILMPEMEGLETIQELMKLNRKLPIVAITGSTDSPYLQVALKLGATKGLYKPFNQADLLSAVNSALNSVNEISN